MSNHNAIMKSSGDSLFDISKMITDGKHTRAFKITCSGFKCNCSDQVPMNPIGEKGADADTKEDIIATRKFENKGWFVGSTRNKHLCSLCIKLHSNHREKMETAIVHPITLVPPPQEVSRIDRRLIYEKLRDVYPVEEKGYSGNWTDKKIAEDFNVPQHLVASIRDEHFGPADAPDMEAVLEAAAESARQYQKLTRKLLDELQANLTNIRNQLCPD